MSDTIRDTMSDTTRAPITKERARKLVDRVCIFDDAEQNAALLALIAGLADPKGDPERYNAACEAMRHIFMYSREFETTYAEFLGGAVKR
jgi:hypothetical protein